MIRFPAIGRPLFRCRLCGWVGIVEPQLADPPANRQLWAPMVAILGLPEWALHHCSAERSGVADLVGFEHRQDEEPSR